MSKDEKVKHTDEPWEMLPLEELQIGPNKRKCYQIIGHHNAVLAIVIADTWYSISGEANALLIAAAPDLLEALQEALTSLEHFYEKAAQQAFVHKQVALPWPEITKARAAISKATGQAEKVSA